MRTAKEIENEIYEKAIALNNNIPDSCMDLHIDDEDLFDLEPGQQVNVYVEIRLVTC